MNYVWGFFFYFDWEMQVIKSENEIVLYYYMYYVLLMVVIFVVCVFIGMM